MLFNVRILSIKVVDMTDAEKIESLGGSTKVAELLGLEKNGGPQRVNNWKTRGIPSKVKVDHPELFMSRVSSETQKAA